MIWYCPKCGGELGAEIRHGITLDVCRGCHGIWLDPGELGALMQRAARPAPAPAPVAADRAADAADHDDDRRRRPRRDDDDDDDDARPDGRRRPPGLLERLADLFD